jgi:DNA-binding beta-propeller fold protein YncE
VGGVSGLDGPQSILVSADGENVYVAGFEDNAVAAFTRDSGTGLLTFLEVETDGAGAPVVDGLEGPQGLAESPDGAFVYVASSSRPLATPGLGGIAVFARDAAGALAFVEVKQEGVGGVSGLGGVRDVVVSPDGLHLYTATGGRTEDPVFPGAVTVFSRNQVDGTLTFVDTYLDSELGIDQPNGIAASPDGSLVYVVSQGVLGFYVGALVVFSRDDVTGELTVADLFEDGAGGVDGLAGAFSVDLSADGAHAYVSSEQDPLQDDLRGAVAIFAPEPGAAGAALAALVTLPLLAARRTAAA